MPFRGPVQREFVVALVRVGGTYSEIWACEHGPARRPARGGYGSYSSPSYSSSMCSAPDQAHMISRLPIDGDWTSRAEVFETSAPS